MSDIKQLPHVARYCINQERPSFKCVVHPTLIDFNFYFLGVIPKPFPKEQLLKSSSAYLTPALEAGNDIPTSHHLMH